LKAGVFCGSDCASQFIAFFRSRRGESKRPTRTERSWYRAFFVRTARSSRTDHPYALPDDGRVAGIQRILQFVAIRSCQS
jgi:hypothetical protein